MNPNAHRTILRQSRIFGYTGAVLSIPFALAGGLLASCCPFGVLVGAIPLLATSWLGAVLAALFMDYSVVSKRDSTGAGLRVGLRTAAVAGLAGGIFTLFTASQSLSLMTAAAASQSPAPEGGVAAAFTIGVSNLFMLLVVVMLCLPGGILWGVIGAAIRGSAALDQEPPPLPEWETEVAALKKGSLIEWGVLLGSLAAVSLVIPMIQQHSIAKNLPKSSSERTVNMPAPNNSGVPLPTPQQTSRPAYKPPFSASPGGKFSVEIIEDSQQGRLIVVKEHGEHLIEEPAMGYLQDVHWSPGEQFVAINERRGNSGDYLWVLDLQQHRFLKRPDDSIWQQLESRAVAILEAKADNKWGDGVQGDRAWGTAAGWQDESTLLAKVTVRFLGSAIAVGEDSRLEIATKLRVASDGIFIQNETQTASRKIGEGLLIPACGMDFMEDTGTLIATFEWYARYGADRMTVNIKDLDLDSVKIGVPEERGALEGGVPLEISLKPNAAAKKEHWTPGPSEFSWSMPPSSLVTTEGVLNTVALSQDKAAALVSELKALRPRSDGGPPSAGSGNATTPSPLLSAYQGKVGRLEARFELQWHPDRSVTGRYWYPGRNPARNYELRGSNQKEGELVLDELTNGERTATIRMNKDSSQDLKWVGTMQNTDGRQFDVTMVRLNQPARDLSSRTPPEFSPVLLVFSSALKTVWSGDAIAVDSLGGLSPWELKILRNAIFARHGRTFESGKLSGFFNRYPGYKVDAGYSDNRITSTDRSNAEVIKAVEARAKRPPRDTAWNALRGFVDALAAGDVEFIASSIHPTHPVERVMFTLEDPPKVAHTVKLPSKSGELKQLWLDDGANGESYCFMMGALWDFTLEAKNAGKGMFRNKGSSTEIGFTEIGGKWWLTRVADAAP